MSGLIPWRTIASNTMTARRNALPFSPALSRPKSWGPSALRLGRWPCAGALGPASGPLAFRLGQTPGGRGGGAARPRGSRGPPAHGDRAKPGRKGAPPGRGHSRPPAETPRGREGWTAQQNRAYRVRRGARVQESRRELRAYRVQRGARVQEGRRELRAYSEPKSPGMLATGQGPEGPD